ncbi:hypothetical protein AB2D16_32935, partial [Pseudomonas aeruginosa]
INVLNLYIGVAGGLIDEAAKLPIWMTKTFSQPNLTGSQKLNLVLTLPKGWPEAVQKAYDDAEADLEDE